MSNFGANQFAGKVAQKYLSMVGLPADLLEDHKWTKDMNLADEVANAENQVRDLQTSLDNLK